MNDTKGEDLAIAAYTNAISKCTSLEEMAKVCQMLAILGIKTLHGIEGDDFKRDFLAAAAADNERITPMKSTVQ